LGWSFEVTVFERVILDLKRKRRRQDRGRPFGTAHDLKYLAKLETEIVVECDARASE